MSKFKHRWVHLKGTLTWCNLCGTMKFLVGQNFWGTKKFYEYVTPWCHPNGDKNTTVFDTEPKCVEIPNGNDHYSI